MLWIIRQTKLLVLFCESLTRPISNFVIKIVNRIVAKIYYLQMTVAVTINPDNVINSPIASDTSSSNVKTVTWCVRTRIAEPTAPTVFAVEEKTPVSVTVNLRTGITELRDEFGEVDTYEVEAFECDENDNAITAEGSPPHTQGGTVRICFQPDSTASSDGVVLDSISWFQWIRGEIIQNVLLDDGLVTAPAITTYQCTKGSSKCSLATQLSNEFFYSAGTVVGRGQALVSRNGGRRLRRTVMVKASGFSPRRRTQSGFNKERALEVMIRIDPSDKIYGAEAYECDKDFKRVSGGGKKKVGDSIRVCVQPNQAALDEDVHLRQISAFSFRQVKSGIAQFAIEPGGHQAPDGKTLLACDPGSSLCAFETNLKEKFFNSNEKLLGRGQVLLQFGTDTDFRKNRWLEHDTQLGSGISNNQQYHRQAQMSDADFAGASEISLDVIIQRRPQSEIDKDEEWDEEAESWWKSQPKILRFIYVMIPLFFLTFLLCCCMIFFCGLCPGWFPDKVQKEVHHEEIVNIEYVREGPANGESDVNDRNDIDENRDQWGEPVSDDDDEPTVQEQAPPSPVAVSPVPSSRRISAPESMKRIEAEPATPRGRQSVASGEASRTSTSKSPRPGGSRSEGSNVPTSSPRPGRKSRVEAASPKKSPRPGRKSSVGGGSSTASPRPGRRSLATDTGATRTPNSTRRNTVAVPNSAPARSRNSVKSPRSGRRASANPHYSAGGKRRTTAGLPTNSIPEVPF